MSGSLKVLLVGGPMYDPLYTRLSEFEESEGLRVETEVAPTHPDLNEQIEAEFTSGGASYDLISTHTKYAPSQRQWLTPLDDDLDDEELEPFTPRTLELARIDGSLYSVPRNLDVKLLLYRTDFMDGQALLVGGPAGDCDAAEVRQPLRLRLPRQGVRTLRPLLRAARDGRRQDVRR